MLSRRLQCAAVVTALLGPALVGCAAEATIGAKVETPPPPAAMVDGDGDGIPEPPDKCPTEAEDKRPPDPADGCPTTDADGDGIPIPQDKCPDQPETMNGFEDDDGCPDEKPLAEVTDTEVRINQKILFEKGEAKILPESDKIIEAVAGLMKKHPDIELVEVAGHASKEGDEYYNRSLTDRRAKAVMAALEKAGVEKTRMVSSGFGFYCPFPGAEGDTETDHEKNRRVEFKILFRGGKQVAQVRGCDAAAAKGIKPAIPKEPLYKAPSAGAETKTPAAAPAAAPPPDGGPKKLVK